MIFILLYLLFFSLSSLEGNEPFQPTANGSFQIANLAGDPTAIVAGCVNVITGDFFDTQRDLLIVGGQPLILERSYSSSDFSMGGLSNGWHFNMQGVVNKKVVKGPYGGEIAYKRQGMIAPDIMHNGLSNNASGFLSGKTNLKNSTLHYNAPHSNNCTVRHGDCAHSIFTKINTDLFKLTSDIKPNGMKLHYNYCKRGLESAFVENTIGDRQQSITLAYPNNSSSRPPSHLRVYASDGRNVLYTFQEFKYPKHQYKRMGGQDNGPSFPMSEPSEASGKKDPPSPPEPPEPPSEEGDHPRFYLSNVVRPNAPSEQYFYESKNTENKHFERVVSKWLPDNRYISISYYKGGQNGSDIFPKDHPWIGRVKALEGPIGTDGNPLEMYRFYYNVADGVKDGSCRVVNALNQITDYYWDTDKRLKKVSKGHLSDELYWGGGQDYGNLQARSCSSNGETLFCKCYRYDGAGNVLNEWLYGNLSGHNAAPLILSANGIPVETGCERIEKRYTYSNDLWNLLLVEEEGDRSKRYRYLPSSDLVEVAFTLDHDKIVLRNSYSYDKSCTLKEEIVDDGVSGDLEDLTGATFRKIRRIKRREIHPFGVPEVIEDYSQDPVTRQEYLLKMQVNSYSAEGRLIKQDTYDSDRNFAFSLHWEYDGYGNVIREVDALGHETHRKFDANSNLIFEQGPRIDCKKEFFYDYSNRLIRADEVHPDRTLSTLFRYDFLSRKTAAIDCYGNETRYEYDEFNRVVKVISPDQSISENVYDPLGNISHTIDPLGNITSATYNLRGKPTQILYPDGSSEHFSYFTHGPLAGKLERNGCSTHYRYDYQDRIIETRCCDASQKLLWVTSATYNALHMLSETDTSGNTTEYTYDVHGRKTSVCCGNRLEEYEYDSFGHVIKKIAHYGPGLHESIVNAFEFDIAGRLIQERTEDSSGNILECTQYAYDVLGKRTHLIKHGQGGTSTSEIRYNSYGQPYEMIDAVGNVTITKQLFTYVNANGQRVAYHETIDPLGNSTILIKDILGRDSELIRKNAIGEMTQKREFFYDCNNNKTKIVETVFLPESSYFVSHIWDYDNMNRVVQCVEAHGSPEQKITSYHFNSVGQLQTIQKPSGVVLHHAYTLDGLLEDFSSSDQTIHYIFTYDGKRNVIESHDVLHKCSTKRTYDVYNQVVEEQLGNDLTLQFSYDTSGRVTKLTLPDASSVAYHYESVLLKALKRLSPTNKELYSHTYNTYDLSLKPTSQTLLGKAGNLSFSYDKKGRTQSIASKFTSELIPDNGYDAADNLVKKKTKDAIGDVDAAFAYDDLYQLVEESGAETHSYQFDSLHNRISKDDTASSFNQLNQIVDTGYVHDPDGRLIKTPTEQFSYDALDRLISYTCKNKTTTYTYDSFNRRLTKTEGNKTWKYLYADQNDIGCYYNGKMIEFRALGLGHGAEIGAAVAIELNNTPYAPIHDLNGNVTTLVSAQGKVVDTYRYTAFGTEITKPKLHNPWKFSSKRYDEESSLTYFGRRYYSPSLGRWLTPDPLAYQAGPNLYAYVSNNPLTDIDLYGLIAERECRTMPSAIYVKEVINNVCERISDCASRVRESVGQVADHISSAAERVGSSVREFSDKYLVSNLDLKSTSGSYAGIRAYSIDGPIIFNWLGQINDGDTCLTAAQNMSGDFGGVPVHYTVPQTNGLLGDTSKSIELKLGFDNINSVKVSLQTIMHFLLNTDRDIFISLHSQSAIGFSCMLKRIAESYHSRLIVHSFGGAKILPKNKLKDCINYVSPYDFVPYLDIIGMISSIIHPNNYKIEWLEPERLFLDHSFTSGPYNKKMKAIGFNYQQTYNKAN